MDAVTLPRETERVRIVQGDCLEVLRGLPDGMAQVCVTSPPYFQLRDYGHPDQIGLEPTPSAFIDALMAVFDEVRRVLRPDGLAFVNLGDSYAGSGKGPTGENGIGDQGRRQGFRIGNPSRYKDGQAPSNRDGLGSVVGAKPKDLLLIPERFAIAMQDRGWYVRSRICWAKTSAMPESVRDRPTSAWEHIWMFSKSARYFYDAEAVRQPATDSTLRDTRTPTSNPPGWSGNPRVLTPDSRSMAAGATSANLRNFWLLGPEPLRESHFAAFPTEIPRRCILAGSRKGDVVLDPFGGAGTTGLVADRLERRAVLIELNPDYCELGRRRIAEDAGSLFGERVAVEAARQPALFGEEVAG